MRREEPNIIAHRVIGNNITTLRRKLQVPQSTFARMVNINRSYFNRIEKGLENPTTDMLIKIADGLEVPLTELYKGLEVCPPRELPNQHIDYFSVDMLPEPRERGALGHKPPRL